MSFFALLTIPPAPALQVGAQAGQVVTLTVRLPDASTGILLNLDAPNTLSLQTPWAKTQAQPSGTPFRGQPEFEGYFSKVNPTALKVRIPAGTKPGAYNSELRLQLFTCDKKELICKQKDLTYRVTIRVGQKQIDGVLNVPAAEFRRSLKGVDGK